jgi:cytochrome c-type biogenesis protein CcmE
MDEPAAGNNPVVSSLGGGVNLTRWSLIVLGIVFLIVVAELTYLGFSQNISIFSKASPTPTPASETEEKSVTKQKEVTYTGGINVSKVQEFLYIADVLAPKKEFVYDSTITLTLHGIIEQIEKDVTFDGKTYAYKLRLMNSGKNMDYFISQGELDKLTVVLNEGERREGTIADIAVGKDVLIHLTKNLIDSSDSTIILEVVR